MKLLYITNGITGSGGLERVLSVKASLLADDFGYEVHILSLNETGIQPFFSFSKNINFHSVEVEGNPLSYFLQYKKEIQKNIDEVQPDIISVCDDAMKGFFLPHLIKTKAKWLHESHASMVLGDKGNGVSFAKKLQHQLKQVLGRSFSKIVLLTESNKQEWNLKNVVVIPNPLPFEINEISTLQNKKVIAVGSYSYNKGYDLLLHVWTSIQKHHPDWELHIYGNRVQENVSKIVTENDFKNIFAHAPVSDIENKYLESSIFVLPSRSEGFGMVIIEAMSCGLPVVSFDCPNGPKDIITNNEDGFLIENGNTTAFTDKVQILIESMELRQKMGQAGKLTSYRYSAQNIVMRWDKLFQSLLN